MKKRCMWPSESGETFCPIAPIAQTKYCRKHQARIHFLVQSRALVPEPVEAKPLDTQVFQCGVCRVIFVSLEGLMGHTCQ